MDDRADRDIFLLAHAQRLRHVDAPIQSFAYARVYGVRGDAVRLDADDVVDFGGEGNGREEGEIYRHAQVLAENFFVVCFEISMEGDRILDGIARIIVGISRRRDAGIIDYSDGLYVGNFVIFLEYKIRGRGRGEHRRADDGDIVKAERVISIQPECGKSMKSGLPSKKNIEKQFTS